MTGGPGTITPSGPLLSSATLRRLRHLKAVAVDTQFSWSAPETKAVPAGKFKVRTLSWRRQDGRTCQLSVEIAQPHRIIEWRCSDGERAQLTGTRRVAYWSTAREGDERLLKDLGLVSPVPSKRP